MANRFVDEKELQQIDLGDGDWVKIPSRLSYGFVAGLGMKQGEDPMVTATKMLVRVVKEWNLKDASGEVVPINEASLKRLDYDTTTKIMNVVTPMISTSPKEPTA